MNIVKFLSLESVVPTFENNYYKTEKIIFLTLNCTNVNLHKISEFRNYFMKSVIDRIKCNIYPFDKEIQIKFIAGKHYIID